METTETTTEAVETDSNKILTVAIATVAVAAIGAVGYKVGNFVQSRLAARKAAKEVTHENDPEED